MRRFHLVPLQLSTASIEYLARCTTWYANCCGRALYLVFMMIVPLLVPMRPRPFFPKRWVPYSHYLDGTMPKWVSKQSILHRHRLSTHLGFRCNWITLTKGLSFCATRRGALNAFVECLKRCHHEVSCANTGSSELCKLVSLCPRHCDSWWLLLHGWQTYLELWVVMTFPSCTTWQWLCWRPCLRGSIFQNPSEILFSFSQTVPGRIGSRRAADIADRVLCLSGTPLWVSQSLVQQSRHRMDRQRSGQIAAIKGSSDSFSLLATSRVLQQLS